MIPYPYDTCYLKSDPLPGCCDLLFKRSKYELPIFCLPHLGLRGKQLFPLGKELPFKILLLSSV